MNFFRRPASLMLMILSLAVAVSLPVAFTGCKSLQSATNSTLIAEGKSVDAAEAKYLDDVLAKRVSTNNFTGIQILYRDFQNTFQAEIKAAMGNSNAVPSAVTAAKAATFINVVNLAK